MFACKEPPDWIICIFYPTGFLRQNAQDGFYTLTARLGCDHSEVITRLLNDKSRHHRYIVSAKLKPALWKLLRERHGIWRGSLFPDSAGAAETAKIGASWQNPSPTRDCKSRKSKAELVEIRAGQKQMFLALVRSFGTRAGADLHLSRAPARPINKCAPEAHHGYIVCSQPGAKTEIPAQDHQGATAA
jgi:hypothetical protein